MISLIEESFGDYVPQTMCVKVESAREMHQTGIGAHVNQSENFHCISG